MEDIFADGLHLKLNTVAMNFRRLRQKALHLVRRLVEEP